MPRKKKKFYFLIGDSSLLLVPLSSSLPNFPNRFLVSHVVHPTERNITIGVYLNLELNIVYFFVEGSVKLGK
jgi:hypothetical protein